MWWFVARGRLQVTKALSQVNKERPASKEEAASALSRALLSVGQDMPQRPPAAKPESSVGEEEDQEEHEDGLETDSLDEDLDEDDNDEQEDDA